MAAGKDATEPNVQWKLDSNPGTHPGIVADKHHKKTDVAITHFRIVTRDLRGSEENPLAMTIWSTIITILVWNEKIIYAWGRFYCQAKKERKKERNIYI